MVQQNTTNGDANGNSGTEHLTSPVPNGTKIADFGNPTGLKSTSSTESNGFRPGNKEDTMAFEHTWIDWDGPVWCSRYGRFENQEDAAADDGYTKKGMPAHTDLNLYRCKCRVPSAHHSYAVDIQRRIEPLVASVVRLEHQVEQLAHHFLNDTENFVRTGHHHEGPNIQGNTDKPTVASSKLNGNNPLTTNKEVVPEMMGGEYSPPSLDGKRFQHPPPPNLSWNQEPEHKDHEPMALTIAKLEHQVRYLMHRMGEMLREGAMVKETEAEREAWEHSHEQRGLVKEMKDDKSAGQHTDMHQEGG